MSNIFSIKPYEIDGIKIYIEDHALYLAEVYHQFSRLFQNQCKQVEELKSENFVTPFRKNAIYNIIIARSHNAECLREIIQSIQDHVKINELIKIRDSVGYARGDNNLYGDLKDFKYLQRDWCDLRAGDTQVDCITDALRSIIQRLKLPSKTSLFVGAGTGRIAVELGDLFKRTIAMDKSYTMAYHFHKLQRKEDIFFYEINDQNITDSIHAVRKLKASSLNSSKTLQSIEYIVADILALPFIDESISIIITAYFIDVIALRAYFNEIDRILPDGGVVINVGPLDYFFSDKKEMFSAEEVAGYFLMHGYQIIHNQILETNHLKSDLSMHTKVYKNWVFAAQKVKGQKSEFEIESGTKITLTKGVRFETLFDFHRGLQRNLKISVFNLDGECYEVDESSFKILSACENEIKVGVLYEKISNDFKIQIEGFDMLVRFVSAMIRKKILQTSSNI